MQPRRSDPEPDASLARLQAELTSLRTENAELRSRLAARQREDPSEDAEFLRSLLGALPAFVARYDSRLMMRFINRTVPGMAPGEALGHSMFEYIDPEYHELARENIERAWETGEPQRYRVIGRGPNGRPAHYETIVTPVHELDGKQGMIFLAVDVTEATEREHALERSQERLRIAVEATGIGLWSWDLATNHVEWSPRMCELMGRTEPLPPDEYLTAVHPEDAERVAAGMARVAAGEDGWTDHRIVTPDGETRWVISRGRVSRNEQGKPVRIVGGNLDATRQRALEARLHQAEKMQAVGTLTAGVAHNVNNMLTVVLPILDELRPHVSQAGQALLAEGVLAARGAADVVRKLMSFARKRRHSDAQAVVRVTDVVSSAIDICRRSLADAGIELRLDVEPAKLLVRCDRSELEQVVVNLIANARDALSPVPGARPRIAISVEPRSDGCVWIVVEDNGPGIERAMQRRIFEPFFTTKGPLLGTGLGLATAWAIVTASGGSIDCESEPREGARFSVRLPICEGASETLPAPVTAPAERASAAAAAILLVEDNDSVRRVISRMLARAGHPVIECCTAASALETLGRHSVDAILLDQSLPDVRGIQIVDDLRRCANMAKILLFTGEDVADEDLSRVDGLIAKPVTGASLLKAIRLALAAGERRPAT